MWNLDPSQSLPLWRADAFDGRLRLASTTRRGGVSEAPYHALNLGRSTADRPDAVAENRRRALRAFGAPAEALVTAGQVHGTRVVRVERAGHVSECDALVTTRPDLVLAVTTADCLPVFFAAPGATAVAHSGWRGTADGMPLRALEAVTAAARVPASAVTVLLGPCIRVCCYEVGEDVARAFPPAAVRPGTPRPHLDLARATRLQLEAAGVAPGNVHDCGACTACDADWYFSHRRDGAASGRHWSLAWIRE